MKRLSDSIHKIIQVENTLFDSAMLYAESNPSIYVSSKYKSTVSYSYGSKSLILSKHGKDSVSLDAGNWKAFASNMTDFKKSFDAYINDDKPWYRWIKTNEIIVNP